MNSFHPGNELSSTCVSCNSDSVGYLLEKNKFIHYICKKCGHLYVVHPPLQNELDNLYSLDTESVINTGQRKNFKIGMDKKVKSNNHWAAIMISESYKSTGLNVLEIGPGDGSLLAELDVLGHNTFGVDNGNYIKAPNYFINLNEASRYFLENMIKIDIIIMIDVIEHINNPFVFFEGFQYFTDEAFLILSTPNAQSMHFKILRKYWKMIAPPAHLHLFSNDSLHNFLRSNKFELVEKFARNPNFNTKNFILLVRLLVTFPLQFKNFKDIRNAYKTRLISILQLILDFMITDNHWVTAKYISI